MHPDHPRSDHIPGLRQLWQEAFGDTQDYLDGFFRLAYSPGNCLCMAQDTQVCAALYWLDMTCRDEKIAYIYAVATAESHRGQGLCRCLMESVHGLLTTRGYAGAVLVPENEGLARMYGKMGYRPCCGISKISFSAGSAPVPLRRVGPGEYNSLRGALLPEGSVELGEAALDFLAIHSEFFVGEGFTLAAVQNEDTLHGLEYLGDPEKLPGIAAALGCRKGISRIPGSESPFAFYHPLTGDAPTPTHFGFAFD